MDDDGTKRTNGELAGEISNALVKIIKNFIGRGPNDARASIDGDTITVTLIGGLTKGERSLLERGEDELVQEMRDAYRRLMEPEFVLAVEEITGRVVKECWGVIRSDVDESSEVFVLEPLESED